MTVVVAAGCVVVVVAGDWAPGMYSCLGLDVGYFHAMLADTYIQSTTTPQKRGGKEEAAPPLHMLAMSTHCSATTPLPFPPPSRKKIREREEKERREKEAAPKHAVTFQCSCSLVLMLAMLAIHVMPDSLLS